jgi:hypothetical protein
MGHLGPCLTARRSRITGKSLVTSHSCLLNAWSLVELNLLIRHACVGGSAENDSCLRPHL